MQLHHTSRVQENPWFCNQITQGWALKTSKFQPTICGGSYVLFRT